jgi:hypothetical protein
MSRKDLIIFDIREEVYERDGLQCQYEGCAVRGWANLQLAHRLSRSEKNIKHVIRFMFENYGELSTRKEAEAILNNKLNLVTSCADHNSSFLIDSDYVATEKLLKEIAG